MRRTGRAVSVGQGVAEGIRQLLAALQRIHRRMAVIQRVDILALGIEAHRAMHCPHRAYRGDGHRRIHVQAVIAQQVQRHRVDPVLADTGLVVHRRRTGIGNGDIQGIAGAATALVGHRDADTVDEGCHGIVVLDTRVVAIADNAGGTVIAGQDQFTLGCRDGHRRGGQRRQLGHTQGAAAHRQAIKAVRGADGKVVGGDPRLLGHRPVGGVGAAVLVRNGDNRCPVGMAFDGHRQLRRTGRAVSVGQGVAEGIGQALVGLERIHRRVSVIQLILVAAIRLQY